MSLAREVLRRSIQARDRSRESQASEDEKRRVHSRGLARQDWRNIKRDMPDAGPHGRATEMARRGYNRARQEGIDRGRRTMAEQERERVERVTAMLGRKEAVTKVRHEREDKSRELRRSGQSRITVVSKSPTKTKSTTARKPSSGKKERGN